MARIDTLGHFLTDVADAIREKTGDTNPINASDFDTVISNIKGGLDIQNGRLVNYKATSGTVPEGTFVKLNTSYSGYTLQTTTSSGACVRDAIQLNNDTYILYTWRYRSSYESPYVNLRVFQVSNSGFIEKVNKDIRNDGVGASNSQHIRLFRIDDTHFALCQLYGTGNVTPGVAIYSYSGGTLSQMSINEYSHNQTNPVYTSYNPNTFFTATTEDTNYLYIHVSQYNGNSTQSKALFTYIINKSDYTISINPNDSQKSYVYYDITAISSNKLIGHQGNVIGVISFDLTTHAYTITHTTLDGYGLADYQSNATFMILNNELFMIYKTSATVIKYCKLTINSNDRVIASVPQTLIDMSGDTDIVNPFNTWAQSKQVQIDTETGMIITNSYSTSPNTTYGFIVKYENGELIHGNVVAIAAGYASGVQSQGGVCGNTILNYAGNASAASLMLSIVTIDDALNINQESGSAITVAPSVGSIQGIATTECTDTTAGDVYVLDA